VKIQEIISAVQEYNSSADTDLLRRAYTFVRDHHKGQTRASGEPYVTHVTEVAFLATKLRLDTASVATALLHDTVEDTDATIDEITKQFGGDVARLVDGVTKLSKVNFRSRAEAQAENFRKMLLAMATDIRVLLVKLCDRVHNMRTLEFLSESRQQRIARETLDIYAPLAHRLGINWMKSELEDLAFRYLKPEIFNSIKEKVSLKKKERSLYIDDVVRLLSRELEQNGVAADVKGRPKHFFSIYQKMERQGLIFDEIFDLIAFRILVPTTMDCYGALGVVHAAWKPIPGRFKDYIAMPKPNNYQSLHTTVIGPQGTRIEIQIRTPEMHEIAERGIAAHWAYKEGSDQDEGGLQLPWLQELVESEKVLKDPHEFMNIVKEDLFPEEVFVFSPRGDVFALKAGATPVDFAFHIHSDVGKHCSGARVNGQQVPLIYQLRNGDTIEIQTSKNRIPNKDWLGFVVTSKAQQRIRAFLKAQERDRSIVVGKELLAKDMRKLKLNYNKLLKDGTLKAAADELGFKDLETLLAEIGYGKASARQLLSRLVPEETNLEEKLAEEASALQKIFQSASKVFRDRGGVKVNGMEDVVFRFAHCCEPLPGDEVVGYVTRGRGVAIHRRDCSQTLSFDPQRLVPVSWESDAKAKRKIKLKVLSLDKVGVVAEMSQTITGKGAGIVMVHASAMADGRAMSTFEILVDNTGQLNAILRSLERVDGVIKVERRQASSNSDKASEGSAVEETDGA